MQFKISEKVIEGLLEVFAVTITVKEPHKRLLMPRNRGVLDTLPKSPHFTKMTHLWERLQTQQVLSPSHVAVDLGCERC
jgi:hypothetical protein